jgi:secreted Zn-dependent insulinase-like peptidase
MASIFSKLLKDALNEFAYDAEIAGVDYGIDNTMYGIFVSTWST